MGHKQQKLSPIAVRVRGTTRHDGSLEDLSNLAGTCCCNRSLGLDIEVNEAGADIREL